MTNRLVVAVLIFIALGLSAKEVDARTPANIAVLNEPSQNLGDQLEYYEDASGQSGLTAIRQLRDAEWTRNLTDIPNFGYADGVYWFRFRLTNQLSYPQQKLIALKYALLDDIKFYQFREGELIREIVTGDTYPFAQRPVSNRNFLFPVMLQANEPLDFFIRVKTQGATQLPLSLWDPETFYQQDQKEQLVSAIYYGMLLVMLFYNLFLFLSIRERPYLYYVCLVFSILVLMSGSSGFLYQYLYPQSPTFHQMSMLLSVPSTMLFASIFSAFFLHLDKTAPRLNMLLNFFSVLFLLCIAGAFVLSYDTSTRISVFLAMPASLVIMCVGPYAWLKGQSAARYFTLAWVFLLGGIVISAASKFGFLPRNSLTENAFNWGSVLEMVLLSFALADRFSRERYARFRAEKQQLQEAAQRKVAENKLFYQATHQVVDGLPNIVMLQQTLHKLLHSETERLSYFTLAFIHLTRIHEINKTLGHANADIILSLFSCRLANLKSDLDQSVAIEVSDQATHYFAHIEGVIFAHIFRSGDIDMTLRSIAEMRSELSDPIEFNGMKLDLGLAVGIAAYPIHGSDIATLIRHARVAIDSADNANDNIGVYSREINPYSARRLALMGELKKAIDEDALELHFQPIVACATGLAVGVEALLRWSHKKLGFIPPDEFIPLAEKTGIMRALTYWVLDNALAAHADWNQEIKDKTISVNISAINLQEKDFVATVMSLLEQHGVAPCALVLEITETAVMADPKIALAILRELADLGVKLAIDDFGTGHSSLSYIRQLPVYEIKIDRSFIVDMDQTPEDAVIVRTTLNMSHDLGYKVVAEGIENIQVLRALKLLGCDYAQGYHLARPMPLDDLKEWFANELEQSRSSGKRG